MAIRSANNTPCNDGYLHVQLDGMADFDVIASNQAQHDVCIFRGQAQSVWGLETSLDRLIGRIKPIGVDLSSTYDTVFELFVKALRGRTPITKALGGDKSELWALGQHFGLATPLLDWTSSCYVALFFAFIDPSPSQSGFRSVWMMHWRTIWDAMQKYNEGRDYNDQYAFVDPITDHNARLIAQAGLFTRQPLNFDVRQWVANEFPGHAIPYLTKIDIPDIERLRILGELKQMNIHSGTLFPDIAGAALQCNETLELMADQRRRIIVNTNLTSQPPEEI